MVGALLGHAGRHGPAHHISRGQLVDETVSRVVAQQRTVPPQRLGEQRTRHGRMVQRRRVELHELDVRGRHAGAQRHGHAVPGRLGRVGGDRKELTRPARGQHDMVGPDLDRRTLRRQRRHSDAAPAFDDEVEGEPPFQHRARRAVGGVDQGALHLGAGGCTAGVDHARARVPPFTGQGQQPGGLPVELHTERDQLVDPGRPFVDEDPDGLLVAQPRPGGQRVGQMQIGRVLVAPEHRGDAALGPSGGRLGEHALGQHAERGRRPPCGAGPASRTAAESPATPLPRTRTLNGPGRTGVLTPVRSG